MDSIEITTYIIISPDEIGKNLNELIESKLHEMYVNKCVKKYGYILEILEFKHDNDIIISRVNQFMYLKCKVKILTITPKIGEIYYGTVRVVYPQGVFISLVNTFDTLIPLDSLKKNGYTFTGNSFINSTGDKIIKPECVLNVKVIAINYDKKSFNCIAEILTEERDADTLIDCIGIEDILTIDDGLIV